MERLKGKIKIVSIRYHKDEWGIVSVIPVKVNGMPSLNTNGEMILKGAMANPIVEQTYIVTADLVDDHKWGKQYDIVSFAPYSAIDENSEPSKRLYLDTIYTEKQVAAMYEALKDPFIALKENDTVKLLTIKGIGPKKLAKLVDKFEDNYSLSKLCAELSDYDLTNAMMKKLLAFYHTPDLIIKKVKENPYMLTEVGGIGFKTADAIAMKGGMPRWDIRRVRSYIYYVLNKSGQEGDSFISYKRLTEMALEDLGEDMPSGLIEKCITAMQETLWLSADNQYIGLMKYRDLESNICNELKRISSAKNSELHYGNLDSRIREIEQEQGWEFTDQQRKGIESVNENCLTVINGLAGTGKSSVAAAVIKLYKDANSTACCLSGKAAARLGEIIGTNGSTIHRLLGYNPQIDGFTYTKNNQLSNNLIIVDEISMIGGSLFYSLLQAIQTGAKVLMLGDTGQLSAIGECNVASDIIVSSKLPLVTLDKIHRQGAKSAIITQSIKIRNGVQIIPKDYEGTECRGELKDLLLDVYSDKVQTAAKMLEYFKSELKTNGNDILKVQMIAPMKTRGESCTAALNLLAQEHFNPYKGQDEVFVGNKHFLRNGDKVIVIKNNYKDCYPVDGSEEVEPIPLFNGFIGIITELCDEYMVVDFSMIGKAVIPKSLFSTVELAYAITAHKFQGAQAETIIFGIDYSSYTMLSRELVYTAITRAQKKCILVAQNTALQYAIRTEKTAVKHTHLSNFLAYNKE